MRLPVRVVVRLQPRVSTRLEPIKTISSYAVFSTGQSLSVGDKGYPLTHNVNILPNAKMFSGLPPIGVGFEVGITDADLLSIVPLAEVSKETHATAMFNWIDPDIDVLYTSVGVGGKTIRQLVVDINTPPWGIGNYNKVVDKVVELGSRVIPFITFIQGEADSSNPDQAGYKVDLRGFHSGVKARSSQEFPMIIDQTGKLGSYIIANTLLEYSEENSDCLMSGPKYWLNRLYPEAPIDPSTSSIRLHLNAEGYMLQGEMIGQAYVNYRDTGRHSAVVPKSISVVPNTGYKKLRVEFGTPNDTYLVVDNTTLPECPAAGLGQKYYSAYGAIAAVGYTQNGNTFDFDMGEPITSVGNVQLGATLDDRSNTDDVLLPCTNIRSSVGHESKFVSGVTWYDWACQFTKTNIDGSLNIETGNLWVHGDFSGVIETGELALGRGSEWLLIAQGDGDVEVTATVTEQITGRGELWVYNTRIFLQAVGVQTITVPSASAKRMYLHGGFGAGWAGSVSILITKSEA
jgi:hypothetical protein